MILSGTLRKIPRLIGNAIKMIRQFYTYQEITLLIF